MDPGRRFLILGLAALVTSLSGGGSAPETRAAASAIAELVRAASPSQAELVARRMEAGFLMDQLNIPGAEHLGRVELSDLDAALREKLEGAGPGRPVHMTRPEGGLLVAQLLPSKPAILGSTEYRQDPSRIGSRPAFNPTNNDLLIYDVPVDSNDLAAVCEAKKSLVANEVESARATVKALPAAASLPDLVSAHGRLGGALSFTGDVAGAIEAFEVIHERMQAEPPSAMRAIRLGMAMEALGILNLRRGEQENCVMHHNREMCLFPLSPAAWHKESDGGRRAVDYFTRQLEMDGDNLEARWLLNVAAMTIGVHPDGVRERFRIGPGVFKSAEDLGRFWDTAESAGLALRDNAGGSVTDDFDNDGLLDVVISSRDPCEPLRLFRNRGDGTFADRTEAAGLQGQLGGLNVTQTDYNNDGWRDLFVMRGGWRPPFATRSCATTATAHSPT